MSKEVLYECKNCKKIAHNRNSRKKLFCTRDCYMEYRTKQPYSYHAIHTWLWRNHKHEKTGYCQICLLDKGRTEWANKIKGYTKDIKNYIELCKPCHERFDNKRHDNFRGRKHSEKSKKQISKTLKKTYERKNK